MLSCWLRKFRYPMLAKMYFYQNLQVRKHIKLSLLLLWPHQATRSNYNSRLHDEVTRQNSWLDIIHLQPHPERLIWWSGTIRVTKKVNSQLFCWLGNGQNAPETTQSHLLEGHRWLHFCWFPNYNVAALQRKTLHVIIKRASHRTCPTYTKQLWTIISTPAHMQNPPPHPPSPIPEH